MTLNVCWGTFPVPWPRRGASWRSGAHPCKRAHDALIEAGHSPRVVRCYGFAEVIADSANIVAWAQEHPASGR